MNDASPHFAAPPNEHHSDNVEEDEQARDAVHGDRQWRFGDNKGARNVLLRRKREAACTRGGHSTTAAVKGHRPPGDDGPCEGRGVTLAHDRSDVSDAAPAR